MTIEGKKISDWYISGEGLCSDQSHEIMLGLGNTKGILEVRVRYPTGKIKVIKNPKLNSVLIVAN